MPALRARLRHALTSSHAHMCAQENDNVENHETDVGNQATGVSVASEEQEKNVASRVPPATDSKCDEQDWRLNPDGCTIAMLQFLGP